MSETKDKDAGWFDIPALPSAQDKLFTDAADWWNTACLNWLRDGWDIYARGYKEAADILVCHVAEQARGQDALVYPVVFLYRQYLELALKDLIRAARKLQEIEDPVPMNHKIADLWSVLQQLLSKIAPGDSVEELHQVGRLITEFARVDPTSMAFRYPEDREGNPSLPGIDRINLRVVREVIAKVAVMLDGVGAQLSVWMDYRAEEAAAYEP